MTDKQITVIGAGSMGTALAKMMGEKGFEVIVWAFENEVAGEINSKRQNSAFLKGFELPANVRATPSLAEAMEGARFVVSATPSQVLRTVWARARKLTPQDAVIVSVSKGVEVGTTRLMSEVFCEVFEDS